MRSPAGALTLLAIPAIALAAASAVMLVAPDRGVAETYRAVGTAFLLGGLLISAVSTWGLRSALGEFAPARAVYGAIAVGAGIVAFLLWATMRMSTRSPIHDGALVSTGPIGAAALAAGAAILAVWLALRATEQVDRPTLAFFCASALTVAVSLAIAGVYAFSAAGALELQASARPTSETLYYRTPGLALPVVLAMCCAVAWISARVRRASER